MSAKLIGGFPDDFKLPGKVSAGVAIAEGDILAVNGNVLERATASSTIHTIVGVAGETISTAATDIKFIPFLQGQTWEIAASADTATTQLYESMALSDHATVSNTDSDVSGPTGVFFCLAIVGSAANRKLIGEFTRLQSTST
jgi:hypothetical protein